MLLTLNLVLVTISSECNVKMLQVPGIKFTRMMPENLMWARTTNEDLKTLSQRSNVCKKTNNADLK